MYVASKLLLKLSHAKRSDIDRGHLGLVVVLKDGALRLPSEHLLLDKSRGVLLSWSKSCEDLAVDRSSIRAIKNQGLNHLGASVTEPKLCKFSCITGGIADELGKMRVRKSDQSQVVDTAGLWISSSLAQLFLTLSLALLEHKDYARSDVHSLEKVALGFSLREALHNPTIDPTVALLQSLLNK